MTNADLAYCAGLIDGEGTIGVYKHKVNKVSSSYIAQFKVTMTRRDGLKHLVKCGGGRIHKENRRTKANKPVYTWKLNIKKAVPFLKRLLPFLILKKRNAENLIAYNDCLRSCPKRRGGQGNPLTKQQKRLRDNFCKRSKKLNNLPKRGTN